MASVRRHRAYLKGSSHLGLDVSAHCAQRPTSMTEAAHLLLWGNVREQPIKLCLDHLIALTRPRLQARPIEYRDFPPSVPNQTRLLQLAGSLGHPFPAHTEHIRN